MIGALAAHLRRLDPAFELPDVFRRILAWAKGTARTYKAGQIPNATSRPFTDTESGPQNNSSIPGAQAPTAPCRGAD